MKIRSLALQNFRKFRAPVRLAGLGDGLNLICEANEFGKSTILEAMRAALFERHGSKSEFIRSLRSWGDETAPTVELGFELHGEPWRVHKRFIQSPRVTLTAPDGSTFTSDDAEDRLQRLLGFERAGNRGADDETRGVLGLLWIEQRAALDLHAPGRVARANIESVLAAQVGVVTGGRRAAAVVAAIDAALAELRTLKSGQATGRLAEARRDLEAMAQAREACAATLLRFGETLDALEAARAEQKRTERESADPQHAADVAGWKRDLTIAQATDGRLREARALLAAAEGRRAQADAALLARKALRARVLEAEAAAGLARAALAEHDPRFERAKAIEAERADSLTEARRTLTEIEARATAARAGEAAAARAAALGAAFLRLDAAEAEAAELAGLEAGIAASPLTADALQTLNGLDVRLAGATAALEAAAPTLEIALLEGAAGAIRIDGAPASPGRRIVVGPIRLEIVGVGAITVAPAEGTGVAAERSHRRALEDLTAALTGLGVETVGEAREGATRRRALEAQAADLRLRLAAACPADPALAIAAGIAPLRAALSARARPLEIMGPETIEETAAGLEAALAAARAAERGAAEAREVAGAALHAAELEQQRLAGFASSTALALDDAAADLARAQSQASEAALETAATAARQDEARAAEAVAQADRAAAAFDSAELERRLANAETRQRNLAQDLTRLAGRIGGLETTALVEGEKGPAAALEEAVAAQASARTRHDRLSAEADALSLLRAVLVDANREATRLYLEPVTRHMAPYVARLLPGATLELTEALGAGTVSRSGRAEPAIELSRGTQEQLAVLTRLAFADLLLGKDQPVSLVLDDALVYSDDARLEVMTDIITAAASRMQVIMLTCRKRAFLHLDANRVSLIPAEGDLR